MKRKEEIPGRTVYYLHGVFGSGRRKEEIQVTFHQSLSWSFSRSLRPYDNGMEFRILNLILSLYLILHSPFHYHFLFLMGYSLYSPLLSSSLSLLILISNGIYLGSLLLFGHLSFSFTAGTDEREKVRGLWYMKGKILISPSHVISSSRFQHSLSFSRSILCLII